MTIQKKENDYMTASDVYELIIEMRREERFNQDDDYEYVGAEEEEKVSN